MGDERALSILGVGRGQGYPPRDQRRQAVSAEELTPGPILHPRDGEGTSDFNNAVHKPEPTFSPRGGPDFRERPTSKESPFRKPLPMNAEAQLPYVKPKPTFTSRGGADRNEWSTGKQMPYRKPLPMNAEIPLADVQIPGLAAAATPQNTFAINWTFESPNGNTLSKVQPGAHVIVTWDVVMPQPYADLLMGAGPGVGVSFRAMVGDLTILNNLNLLIDPAEVARARFQRSLSWHVPENLNGPQELATIVGNPLGGWNYQDHPATIVASAAAGGGAKELDWKLILGGAAAALGLGVGLVYLGSRRVGVPYVNVGGSRF